MTQIKPNRVAHVRVFPASLFGTIKNIVLCQNAGAEEAVRVTEPDIFYSAFEARNAD